MNKKDEAALLPPGYFLSEEGYVALEHLRDELLLVAHLAFATTVEEEHMPLEIKRSMLGQLLERYGLRVDDVLMPIKRVNRDGMVSRVQH
jgi:hypothetical protein